MASQKITQTAGRQLLGSFAPDFAHFNDDILFGENWNIPALDLKTRSLITVVTLVASGITDGSLTYHLNNAKAHGVTREEIAAAITHVAFYAGWPKAWAAFNQAKNVWTEEGEIPASGEGQGAKEPSFAMKAHAAEMVFPIGNPNTAYAKVFTGQSYLAPLSTEQVSIWNVTFEPGCRNNWHVHTATAGGGQILVCVAGRGIYQEEGKPAQHLKAGDTVNIPAGVKHWHGAEHDSWFSHLAIEVPGTDTGNQWLEPVTDDEYKAL